MTAAKALPDFHLTDRGYAHYRKMGRRTQQATAAARRQPAQAAPAPEIGRYQRTPAASKGNAFCWLTWEPQIDWRRNSSTEAMKKASDERREQLRAEGIDTGFIPGMGSSTKLNPKQFAMPRRR
jgi:hypothetical protein